MKQLYYFFIVMCYQYFNLLKAVLIVYPIQDLQYAFLRAAKEGELDKVKDFIKRGYSVNTRNQVKFVQSARLFTSCHSLYIQTKCTSIHVFTSYSFHLVGREECSAPCCIRWPC